mmetsp:Transcript_34158/g.24671  ORF Transcript_34158/g.24671 Transcript_34158/m.24671 type:complete len:137 (-) Transcript_34158:1357-1767(-)
MSYCFIKLTKRTFRVSADLFLDFALVGCICVWVERYFYYHTHHTGHPFAANEPNGSNSNYMINILEHNEIGDFHFDYLLAAIGMIYWLRLFNTLQLTRTLGPLIKIVQAMISDLFSFLTLYSISLAGFTSLGMMLF